MVAAGIASAADVLDLDALPAAPPAQAERAELRRRLAARRIKLAVVDDDPTGTQTVRDLPLVTDWSEDELTWAMTAADPAFALLTNSRALPCERAVAINCEIGERLALVARRLGVALRVLSRSDSTLRGHFPAEPEALAAGLHEGGEPAADAVLLCPAFPEAGRITAHDVQWVLRDGAPVPAAETEYARDPAFGYEQSNLLEWVRERAGDQATTASVSLEDVRAGAPRVAERLLALRGEARYVVANAVEPADLAVLALGVELAEQRGLRLIYRTGPSFVSARAGVATAEPLAPAEIAMPGGRGLLVVGSHTALTTAQLDAARARHDFELVTLDVADLRTPDGDATVAAVAHAVGALRAALAQGDAALVTSRTSAHAARGERSLQTSNAIADALVEIVAAVARDTPLDWLVAKGGITSHDMAVRALGTRRATVLGQLFPGQVSVWELGEGGLTPGLRYVVFPGNVGDEAALAGALDCLKGQA